MLKMQSSARRKAYITAMKLLMGVAAVLTCALVVGMIGYILGNGIPNITWEMLSTAPSYLANRVGILPDILSTLYIVIATLLIVLPLGVGAAIYLNEYAANKKLVSIIEYASETLSGIPSIIYGLVGMLIFCKNGTSLLAGALTLTIMILPTIIGASEPTIRAVEQSYYEGALALGATHERSVFTVVVPAAKSGILAAVILGVGRALGETMAVMMVVGNQPRVPNSILQGGRTLTTNIVMEMGHATDLHREALIATGVVLFAFILIINLCFSAIKRSGKE